MRVWAAKRGGRTFELTFEHRGKWMELLNLDFAPISSTVSAGRLRRSSCASEIPSLARKDEPVRQATVEMHVPNVVR